MIETDCDSAQNGFPDCSDLPNMCLPQGHISGEVAGGHVIDAQRRARRRYYSMVRQVRGEFNKLQESYAKLGLIIDDRGWR